MTLLFFCLKIWGVLSALGQLGVLVPVDLVLYGAGFGSATRGLLTFLLWI